MVVKSYLDGCVSEKVLDDCAEVITETCFVEIRAYIVFPNTIISKKTE